MINGFKTSFTQLMEKGQNAQIIGDTIVVLTVIMRRGRLLFQQNVSFCVLIMLSWLDYKK